MSDYAQHVQESSQKAGEFHRQAAVYRSWSSQFPEAREARDWRATAARLTRIAGFWQRQARRWLALAALQQDINRSFPF